MTSGNHKALASRIAGLDWTDIHDQLDQQGHCLLPALLDQAQCQAVIDLYGEPERFRKQVIMGQHGYGQGEYRYFAYPLPDLVQTLRERAWPMLVPLANNWSRRLGQEMRYPEQHADYIRLCHEAGQQRPTPLILRYAEGDYNRLHQDLYGEHLFPLQLAILLSQPGEDFEGGEFVLTEQRARMQSRPEVVPLTRGDAVIFAVNQRPVPGKRGETRVQHRHGVSRLRAGQRHTLGIIFHDAT